MLSSTTLHSRSLPLNQLEQAVQYISSTGPTLNQLEQAVQYISSTGPTLNQLEQAVQYISSTGPTLNQLEKAVQLKLYSTITDMCNLRQINYSLQVKLIVL